jgi:hypothetical protein
MKQNEEKVDLDTQEVIKRYKREVANLHRALNRLQKDKEQLFVENLRLKEILNKNNSIMILENEVPAIKELRRDIDSIIDRVRCLEPCRETDLVIIKLQEAVMWLGMDLKRLNEPNPYPNSKDPSTGTKIDPTADGLHF